MRFTKSLGGLLAMLLVMAGCSTSINSLKSPAAMTTVPIMSVNPGLGAYPPIGFAVLPLLTTC